jgi:uncharacterized repeat protein (TIGR03843 family)
VSDPIAERILGEGEMEIVGRLPNSSNRTFLVRCTLQNEVMAAVYKPVRGERPLWDFPPGLHRREAAAYELSRALGWDIVPETRLRGDAPLGPGSLQRFVDADFEQHYLTLLDDASRRPDLLAIAAFDVAANNADRKSGHCLFAEGRVWAVDNGLCFHVAPKLRTVIWDFAGELLPEQMREDLARFSREPPESFVKLLEPQEVAASCRRASALADVGALPTPDPATDRLPWPPV